MSEGGSWEVLRGDAVELIEDVETGSADLVFADWPFDCQDGRTDYREFSEVLVGEIGRVASGQGNVLVINNPHNIFKTLDLYQEKFNLRNTISLIRKGAFHPAHHFGFQHNQALVLYKGDVEEKWNGPSENHESDFYTDVMEYQNTYSGPEGFHPQAIPEDLSDLFVELLTDSGDLVVDVFAGSGTVGVSSVKNGRDYIGFEYDEEYCKMARKRIRGNQYKEPSIEEEIEKQKGALEY